MKVLLIKKTIFESTCHAHLQEILTFGESDWYCQRNTCTNLRIDTMAERLSCSELNERSAVTSGLAMSNVI